MCHEENHKKLLEMYELGRANLIVADLAENFWKGIKSTDIIRKWAFIGLEKGI